MTEIIVAAISLLGTLGGSLGVYSEIRSKMTNYRIQQPKTALRSTRTLPEECLLLKNKIKVANHELRI